MIPESQWRYYRHWLLIVLATEAVLLIRNHDLFSLYLGIAALFLGGFLLRLVNLYPGQSEPLILDFSAVAIAAGFAFLSRWLGDSVWRFLLILCSSAILIPHFVYIAREK